MLFLDTVIIKNFQSHKETRLDFVPGLNVIIGPSDQGKSSIIRAINWVLFNEPRGTEFIRQGASECSVTLILNNGYKITRLRSSSKNRYILTLPDGTQQIFEGFGTGVPLEVQNAHNIKKVLVDVDAPRAINISHQLESPFLISETGTTRAKAIGRIVGVHILDKASRETERDISRLQSSLKSLREQLDDVIEGLKEFEGLEELGTKIDLREKQVKKIKDLEGRANKLNEYNRQFKEIILEENKVKYTINILGKLPKAESLLLQAENLTERYKTLSRKWEQLKRINARISETLAIMNNLPDINKAGRTAEKLAALYQRLKILKERDDALNRVQSNIQSLQSTVRRYSKIEDFSRKIYPKLEYKFNRLSTLEEMLKTFRIIEDKMNLGHQYLKKRDNEIALLVQGYQSLLKKLGRCPLCLQEINHDTIDRILKEDNYERI